MLNLLGGLLPGRNCSIIVHPMCGGLLRKPAQRRVELYKLHSRELLRYRGSDGSDRDVCCWQVCVGLGDFVHGVLDWLLPEHIEPSIVHPMRNGLLYKPRQCRYKLHELHGWQLLRVFRADGGDGFMRSWNVCGFRGECLHSLLGRLVSKCLNPIFLHSVHCGLLRKPCDCRYELYKLPGGELLCVIGANFIDGPMLCWKVRGSRGKCLLSVFFRLLPERFDPICVHCMLYRPIPRLNRSIELHQLLRGKLL